MSIHTDQNGTPLQPGDHVSYTVRGGINRATVIEIKKPANDEPYALVELRDGRAGAVPLRKLRKEVAHG